MIPAILAALPSVFQGAQGLIQMIGGKRQLDNLQRPEYRMPEEINSMLTLAQAQYGDPYSTENLNAQRSIGMGAANAVMAGRDSGNLAGILPAIVGQQNAGYNQAAQMQEATKARERAVLTDMLGTRAKYKDMEFQMNEFAPYQQQYNEGRERIGAGQQNMFSALNGLSSIGQMFFSNRQEQVAPGAAAGYTSGQVNGSALLQGLLDGYANSAMQGTTDTQSYPGIGQSTDTQSYMGQNGIQNKYAGQFNNMLTTFTQKYPY